MQYLAIRTCLLATFAYALAQNDVSLCSQVYQMHQYCTRNPPKAPAVVDYEVITAKILDAIKEQVNKIKVELDDKILRLQNDVKSFAKKVNSVTGWQEASSGGIFFKVFHTQVNYSTAKKKCDEEGAILASKGIRDPSVFREIQAALRKVGSNTWIGLDDIQEEGRWVWADGTVGGVNNLAWGSSQPNNYQGNEDCVYFWNDTWKLHDQSCEQMYMYVCEKYA